MKNKLLITSVLFLLGLGVVGVKAQTINVMEKSGTQTSFPISEVKTLTFTNNNLNVNKKDGSIISTAFFNVRYLNFSSTTSFNTVINESFEALMYPNPMQNVLKIDCKIPDIIQSTTIEVMTIDGRLRYHSTFNSQHSIQHSINVSGWEKGMYIVRMNIGKESIIRKIIKN
ncbi:MAG: T9SS type A sorting domain-containing protein [Paludibacter sp.]|jgi:hypothetical protein